MTELELLNAARAAAPTMTEAAWCRAVGIGYQHWCRTRRGESTPPISLILRAGDLAGLKLCWEAAQAEPQSTITTGDGA